LTGEGLVLVVDDDRTSRRKLTLALNALGYASIEAAGGKAALEMMRTHSVDLILLDIVMPEIDGFEVLRQCAEDPQLAEIPTLVISGLDGDMASVVRAIKLGAADFLPKQFDAVLFQARVSACIEKRRLRLLELDHRRQVDRLIAAAETMESSSFHPRKLGLDEVAARPDAVGKLGRVFRDMAEHVYDRERQLQRNLRTTKGVALLMATGIASGLGVPLSILLYRAVPMPVGTAMWVNVVAGLVCLAIVAASAQFKRPSGAMIGFLVSWAVLHGLATILMFEAAGRVSGIMLSIILALEGFIVFLLAALMRTESPSLRRFAGLCVGLGGVLVLLLARNRIEGVSDWLWILIALIIPTLYAFMDILADQKQPSGGNAIFVVGLVMILSAAMTAPLAFAKGQFFSPFEISGEGAVLILVEGARTAAAYVFYILLIAVAGAVFGSQNAYVSTLAGIGWSILLLSETLTLVTLAALITVLAGLMLVGTKREAEDAEVRFVRRKHTV